MKMKYSIDQSVSIRQKPPLTGTIVRVNVAKGTYRVRCSDGITRLCTEEVLSPIGANRKALRGGKRA